MNSHFDDAYSSENNNEPGMFTNELRLFSNFSPSLSDNNSEEEGDTLTETTSENLSTVSHTLDNNPLKDSDPFIYYEEDKPLFTLHENTTENFQKIPSILSATTLSLLSTIEEEIDPFNNANKFSALVLPPSQNAEIKELEEKADEAFKCIFHCFSAQSTFFSKSASPQQPRKQRQLPSTLFKYPQQVNIPPETLADKMLVKKRNEHPGFFQQHYTESYTIANRLKRRRRHRL